jgi:hypothetical protein
MSYKNPADKKAYNDKYYKENAEKIKAQEKIYRSLNKDKIKIYAQNYKNKHKSELSLKTKLHYSTDKIKYNSKNKEYYQSHRLELIEKRKLYYQTHKDEIKARAKNKIIDPLKKREYSRKKYERYKDKIITRIKEYSRLLKLKVVTYYGNGICACVKCGFSDIRALTIDHINGEGHKHRKDSSIRGNHVYLWLKKNNYPEGFQTLCMNCQMIKRARNKEYYTKGKNNAIQR